MWRKFKSHKKSISLQRFVFFQRSILFDDTIFRCPNNTPHRFKVLRYPWKFSKRSYRIFYKFTQLSFDLIWYQKVQKNRVLPTRFSKNDPLLINPRKFRLEVQVYLVPLSHECPMLICSHVDTRIIAEKTVLPDGARVRGSYYAVL